MRQEIPEEVGAHRFLRNILAPAALAAPGLAHASFLSGEALDTAANVLSWVVIIVVPLVAIALFLYVHVLPEVIAEKRHHPQKHAIKTLCILSLFFGGLLWPLAWLWAYTRPVMFRAAYGSEKHEDYFHEMEEKAKRGELGRDELVRLRHELGQLADSGSLPAALRDVRKSIDDLLERHPAPPEARKPVTEAEGPG